MFYTKIQLHFTRQPLYRLASSLAKGCWLDLILFCAETENGGIIADCRLWASEQWAKATWVDGLYVAAVVKAELASWDGDALVVHGYDGIGEAVCKIKCKSGRKGGIKSGAVRRLSAEAKTDFCLKQNGLLLEPNPIQSKPIYPPTPPQGGRVSPLKRLGILELNSIPGLKLIPDHRPKWLALAEEINHDLAIMTEALHELEGAGRQGWVDDLAPIARRLAKRKAQEGASQALRSTIASRVDKVLGSAAILPPGALEPVWVRLLEGFQTALPDESDMGRFESLERVVEARVAKMEVKA